MRQYVFLISVIFLLAACQDVSVDHSQPKVQKALTQLRVGTLNSPQSYLQSPQGQSGFDYEMAVLFAQYLNVELDMQPYPSRTALYQALKNDHIDIIAAGMTATPTRREQFRIGPTLYQVSQVLVYRVGTLPPKNMGDLAGKLTVIADSAVVETLIQLQKHYPTLIWEQITDIDSDELLTMIANKDLDYTVADSNSVQINRRYLPELRLGPVLEEKIPVVWLLAPKHSDRLMSQLLAFWNQAKLAGTIENLNEKYFGHVKRFDYVDTRAFIRAIDKVLPRYRHMFEKYAGTLDWRKLAAVSYQESHWNPKARSPTGVRGMMMLTLLTAKELGVTNRLDAEESIRGGAAYLKIMMQRMPSVPESQKIWFALAAYNMGYSHLEDARKLAVTKGLNPDYWRDIKTILPLLQQRKYYKQARFGYARGAEAVSYVENIRRYYDTLVWVDNQSQALSQNEQE